VARGLVEPLQIVHEAQQWLLLSHLGQERERGQAHQEAVGRSPGAEAERDAHRVLLRRRQRLDPVEERRAELVQAGERQLPLGLDATDLRYPEAGGAPSGVTHERRLAHTRPHRG
jgi:hypothetical protein